MASNAQRGAYYKGRTKKYLLGRGYQVANLEEVLWIHPPGRSPIPVKRDQFGADLLAVNRAEIVFVQVKSGKAAEGAGEFPDARRKFAEFVFPGYTVGGKRIVRRWVVAWVPGSRFPRIVEC